MRFPQIKQRTDWNDLGGIDVSMCHVVMPLNVVEIDCFGDAWLLIQIHQVTLQIWIVDDPPQIAFEVAVVNSVEPNQSAEKSPIRFNDAVAEKKPAL